MRLTLIARGTKAAAGMALAVLGAASVATAADVIAVPPGGLKDHHGPVGIPVPAPVPVPDYYSRWYLRGDASLAWSTKPDIRLGDGAGIVSNGGDDNGLGGVGGRFGVGVGYYFFKGFRGDITIDTRSQAEIKLRGAYFDTGVGIGDGGTDIQQRNDVDDYTRGRNWTGLVNLYADLPTGTGFTPYVGAGIGLSLQTFRREWTVTTNCINGMLNGADCSTGEQQVSTTGLLKDNGYGLGFAWALMAGFSYDVSEHMKADLGYRYLNIGGSDFSSLLGTDKTKISIGDSQVHEIRAGLRLDLK